MKSLTLISPAPRYFLPLVNDRNFFSRLRNLPQLGLLALEALTPSSWSVDIIDERVDNFDPDKIDSPLVGITTMTYMAPRAFEIARMLKKRGKTVILGGYFPTLTPDLARSEPSIDSIIIGRAELSWPKLLEDFSNGQLKSFYDIPFRQKNFKLPAINNTLFGKDKGYNSYISQVQATLGCKFCCKFCAIPHFHDNQFVMRDMDDLVEAVKNTPTKKILFVDDNILNNPTYLETLCDRIKPLSKEWVAQISMDIAKHKRLIKKMADSGCIWLNTGIETIAEKTIKAQQKWQNNVNAYLETINHIKGEGINLSAGIVLGFPDDPPDIFDLTGEFLDKASIDIMSFHIYCPYPGTPEYESYLQEGALLTQDLELYDTYHPIVKPEHFTPNEITENFKKLETEFYSMERVITRSVNNVRHLGIQGFIRTLVTGTQGAINIKRGIPTQP